MTFRFYVLWFARNRAHGSRDYRDAAMITINRLIAWDVSLILAITNGLSRATGGPSFAFRRTRRLSDGPDAVREKRPTEDKKERHEGTQTYIPIMVDGGYRSFGPA